MTTPRDVIVNAVREVFVSKKYPWTPQGRWELESDLERVSYFVAAKVQLDTEPVDTREFTITLRVHGCREDVVVLGSEIFFDRDATP